MKTLYFFLQFSLFLFFMLSYICFLGFVKFYRRFTLENYMAMLTAMPEDAVGSKKK